MPYLLVFINFIFSGRNYITLLQSLIQHVRATGIYRIKDDNKGKDKRFHSNILEVTNILDSMITEKAIQDFVIYCTSGASKPQIMRHMKEYYDCGEDEVKELMEIHNFKKRPRFINYKKFYDLKIPDTAEKLKYPFTQIYKQKNFLSQEECKEAIEYMDTELHPSAVSNEDDHLMISEYRTSMTCNFSPHLTPLGADLTIKIGNYLNLDPFLGESIQGQKYEEGEFYKSHWDYYDPLTAEYHTYCQWMGQRTWTFMIYLNDVEEGGETYFRFLNLKVKPEPGLAIFWNNLYSFGWPNFKTMHEALPPIKGKKYILTKWYRSWTLI